jgi:hypothetical protein
LLLNLLYLTSPKLFAELPHKLDLHSDVKLRHQRFDHIGPLLECLFEKSIDLMVLEYEYLHYKAEEVMKILPQYDGLKLLIAKEPKEVFFAFRMNINYCSSEDIDPKEVEDLIRACIKQKNALSQQLEPYEKKILLPQQDKENFKIIQWEILISFEQKKKQTLIHQTHNISFTQPMSYQEVQKKNLPKTLFYELRAGFTINLNHLRSIEFIQNNYYHCNLSDGRVVEINGSDRVKLLQFLETIS